MGSVVIKSKEHVVSKKLIVSKQKICFVL